jgi:LmbE family N-acetylglucosaminyl deacetylase
MPLYHPEQLNEPGAGLGQLTQVFLFATDRDPDVFVDVTPIYESKLAACLAHRSQFPGGLESLEWLKELDGGCGKVIGVPYAESFRQVQVW